MKIFNTLSGQKEEFLPQGETVKMYVCGVTPYDDCHIGHAMSYIVFDTIRRYLEYRGYKVKYVQNFTDIDDKIIDRSQQLGISTQEMAARFIEGYFADMDALNIKQADAYPRATQEVPKIIEMVQTLLAKGYAYESRGSVYFRVRSSPDYGKLSHRSLEQMIAGTRFEPGEDKEDPMDFALWKVAKPGEPCWESPWGAGRPGWHIECSAMSVKYLGETIDIHGGGQDLVFPHHENEIAQSECFTGIVPFARYWLHNGLVQLDEAKMSKSLGNLVTVRETLERFSADTIRLFVLSSHYRSPLTYSEEVVEAAEKGLERLRQTAKGDHTGEASKGDSPRRVDQGGKAASESPTTMLDSIPFKQRFIEAMDDDFNTAQAVAVLFELAREINRAAEENSDVAPARQTLLELAGVLGLTLEERKPALDAEPFIELLITVRNQLRQAKQWQLADMIRSELAKQEIALEDTSKGTLWKHRRETRS